MEGDVMPEPRKETIVVGVDYSDTSHVALHAAVRIASSRGGGPVHVVNVIGGYDPMKKLELAYESHRLNLDAEREKLATMVSSELARYRKEEGEADVELAYHVLAGPPAQEITRVAAKVKADLVIVGTHGRRGVERLVLGSVAEEVLRIAQCPVLVMRHKDWSKDH
jgi:nucleotide-binding universal stress UspA family protein